MFVFSCIFSLLWKFTFLMFWKCYRCTGKISPDPWMGKIWVFPSIFHELGKIFPNFFRNLQTGNDMAFHRIFPMLWEFVHSQTLGITGVFINSKSVRYSRTGELPVFPHTCSIIWEFTYGLGIVWISASREICKKTHNFGMFVFSHTFPLT